jgi:hypothetical protein
MKGRTSKVVMSEAEFRDHSDSYNGFCINCMSVTREGGTEGDAVGYTCPDCRKKSCFGMDMALVFGYVVVDADLDSKSDED